MQIFTIIWEISFVLPMSRILMNLRLTILFLERTGQENEIKKKDWSIAVGCEDGEMGTDFRDIK